jgi:hypothetical protein
MFKLKVRSEVNDSYLPLLEPVSVVLSVSLQRTILRSTAALHCLELPTVLRGIR